MKIYLAGPLFTAAEYQFNEKLAETITDLGHAVFLPQHECEGLEGADIFTACKAGVEKCDTVIAILDGADADSGTSWEVGYAYALKKEIIGIRTDFRGTGDSEGFNAMLLYSCNSVYFGGLWQEELLEQLK